MVAHGKCDSANENCRQWHLAAIVVWQLWQWHSRHHWRIITSFIINSFRLLNLAYVRFNVQRTENHSHHSTPNGERCVPYMPPAAHMSKIISSRKSNLFISSLNRRQAFNHFFRRRRKRRRRKRWRRRYDGEDRYGVGVEERDLHGKWSDEKMWNNFERIWDKFLEICVQQNPPSSVVHSHTVIQYMRVCVWITMISQRPESKLIHFT